MYVFPGNADSLHRDSLKMLLGRFNGNCVRDFESNLVLGRRERCRGNGNEKISKEQDEVACDKLCMLVMPVFKNE